MSDQRRECALGRPSKATNEWDRVEIIEYLTRYQAWRRGEDERTMIEAGIEPAELGRVIDAAIGALGGIVCGVLVRTEDGAQGDAEPVAWRKRLEALDDGFANLCNNLASDPYLWGYCCAMRKDVQVLLSHPPSASIWDRLRDEAEKQEPKP